MEARIKKIEKKLHAGTPVYSVVFEDGSVQQMQAVDAVIARINAVAGCGPEIVSADIVRGSDARMTKTVKNMIGGIPE